MLRMEPTLSEYRRFSCGQDLPIECWYHLAGVDYRGDPLVRGLLFVEPGLAFDGVWGPKGLASGVNALDGFDVSLLRERGVLFEETSPRVDRMRALQENHPTVQCEV